ncbi:MAG: hypothetical protein HY727_09945 [Candidatus Rokubacteria bacterium]|nr:hypothetical protein [Candidatus Rokubacteria bacterium]
MTTRHASSKRGRQGRARRPGPWSKRASGSQPDERGRMVDLYEERVSHPETSPRLTGGDLDADWQRALSTGEEAVGGSVATPDQDVVDEIGRALGLEQEADAPVRTHEEILAARDRHYWHLERRAADVDEE